LTVYLPGCSRARHLQFPGGRLINELTFTRAAPGHRRLAYCIAISTLTVAALLAVLDWPPEREGAEPLPAALDLLLTPEKTQPKPEPVEELQTDERVPDTAPEESVDEPVTEPAADVTAADPDEVAAPPASPPVSDDADRKIDWQASLERASAETVESNSKPDSLHPAFDELRRIAAVKYAPPRTGKPPPIWENVEEDIYGRTLLRHGNCFRVLDDMNVGNRYAFETFEQHVVFCDWRGQGRQEFPWVETIVARYAYLREPDGGLAAIDNE
jgi:hypothetical protein